MQQFLDADVPVGAHLADQLMLLLALAGGGAFRTVEPTLHTTTQVEVIRQFLTYDVVCEKEDERAWRVEVRPLSDDDDWSVFDPLKAAGLEAEAATPATAPAVAKLGGKPWIEAGTKWPMCRDLGSTCDQPLQLLLQLDLERLPVGKRGKGLPAVFYCPTGDLRGPPHPRGEACEARGSPPDSAHTERRSARDSPELIVGWEQIDDYPTLHEKSAQKFFAKHPEWRRDYTGNGPPSEATRSADFPIGTTGSAPCSASARAVAASWNISVSSAGASTSGHLSTV